MENIGGGLGFRATLDIDDFNVSAQAMERRIKDFSNTAIDEVGSVEDSFRLMAERAGQYISYYLVGQGMKSLLSSIVMTRGQFQQLEIAFETMLGSGSKAQELMGQMIDTAAKTPFDLMGVAEGAKQLMAYGVSAVIEPGGSVRDEEVIACANENNMALYFSHKRHFLH